MVEKNVKREAAKRQRSKVGSGMNLGSRIMEKSKKAKRRKDKVELQKEEY